MCVKIINNNFSKLFMNSQGKKLITVIVNFSLLREYYAFFNVSLIFFGDLLNIFLQNPLKCAGEEKLYS